MSDPSAAPEKLYARDLVAFSDAELDAYLKQRRHESGITQIAIHDPSNLPESFIQRLRCMPNTSLWAPGPVDSPPDHSAGIEYTTQRAPPSPSPSTWTRSVPDVSARLLAVASRASPEQPDQPEPTTPRSYRSGQSPTLSPSPPESGETRCYEELVQLGSRPMYPFERMSEIASNPTAHRHLFRPWSPFADSDAPEWSCVFRSQLAHWHTFRWWQARARRRDGVPPDLDIGGPRDWPQLERVYQVFARDFRPIKSATTYSEAASSLLGRNGFTRPIQLCRDPRDQDKVTEWIEYLTFEYAMRHLPAWRVECLQAKHDAAWDKVVDSGLLRPFGTVDYVREFTSGFQYQKDRERAEYVVERAETALWAAQGGPDKVAEATSRLNEAKQALKSHHRRGDLIVEFIRVTGGYYDRKEEVQEQDYVIEWILSELPIVEAEVRQSGAGDAGPEAASDEPPAAVDHEEKASSRKRPRALSEEGEALDTSKRLRKDVQDADPVAEVPSAETSGRETAPQLNPLPSDAKLGEEGDKLTDGRQQGGEGVEESVVEQVHVQRLVVALHRR